jgi:hypothetical protein
MACNYGLSDIDIDFEEIPDFRFDLEGERMSPPPVPDPMYFSKKVNKKNLEWLQPKELKPMNTGINQVNSGVHHGIYETLPDMGYLPSAYINQLEQFSMGPSCNQTKMARQRRIARLKDKRKKKCAGPPKKKCAGPPKKKCAGPPKKKIKKGGTKMKRRTNQRRTNQRRTNQRRRRTNQRRT